LASIFEPVRLSGYQRAFGAKNQQVSWMVLEYFGAKSLLHSGLLLPLCFECERNSVEPYRIVLTTVSSMEEAKRMARSLVEERVAACVNIAGGVESVYRWKGAVEEAQEVLLLIKTRVEKLAALEEAVRRLHSYDVPEFLILKVDDGGAVYLKWLDESLE
jgi:periplasmic divalent cation tolerance protein